MSKKFFLTFLCFVALSFSFLVAQESSSVPNEENQVIENTENTFDESSVILSAPQENQAENRGSSTFSLLVRMIVVLIIVVACIYFVFRFMKKNMSTPENDDIFMRIVSSVNISPTKSVQIVTLTDKYAFMIGVSDDSVNLISQIDDTELIQAMNLYSDKQKKTNKPKNFADILDIFMPNGPREKKDENVMSGAKNKIAELLEKQRNKLNGGK